MAGAAQAACAGYCRSAPFMPRAVPPTLPPSRLQPGQLALVHYIQLRTLQLRLQAHPDQPPCLSFCPIAWCRYGRRSWKPWLASLALEVVSSRMTAAGVHAATTAQVQRPADCMQRLYMPRSFRSVWGMLALRTSACLTELLRSALMAVPGACQVLFLFVSPGSWPCKHRQERAAGALPRCCASLLHLGRPCKAGPPSLDLVARC